MRRSSGDSLTLEVYRKSGKSSTGLTAHDQTTMAELERAPTTPVMSHADVVRTDHLLPARHARAGQRAWCPSPPLKVAFNKSIGGGVLV